MKLRMEKAIYGGASLARVPAEESAELAGKAVFVPFALPGELVDAGIAGDRRGYLTADLRAVLEPSPGRISPGCEYYGRCGGCHYQHAEYAAQLALKQAVLAETLARARVAAPEEIDILSAQPWGYRNRIRLHVVRAPRPALAYREAASHRDLAIDRCPVAAPLLQHAIAECNRLLIESPEIAGALSEVEFFTVADESALLISLYTSLRKAPSHLPQSIAGALLSRLPSLAGVHLFSLDPAGGSKPRRSSTIAAWGKPALDYAVGRFRYRVSAGAFFQVNRYLLPQLLERVVGQGTGDLAWDLYAGVGLFAQALTQQFEGVIAVESSPASVADLTHNLRGSGHRRIAQPTLRFLQSPPSQRPDLVVADPPRAGLGVEVSRLLAAARPHRIVYVSCDPATLARDLAALQPSGYRLAALTLIDLFPQTFHLETVAHLERNLDGS